MSSHFLVLTSAAPLGDDLLAAASDLAGAPARRLGAGAADLPCGPDALAAARTRFTGVDANLVPAANREKPLLIADMDSTIIPVECIDEIADLAGVGPQVSDITERAMQGELDFEGALRARVALLRDLPVEALDRVWAERITLNPGAETLVRTMAARGAMTALVSGGFTFFADRVAEAAGFAFARANTLIVADGKLTGEVTDPILGREAKLEALNALTAERGLTPADAIAVGDGANDLAMVEAAGLGVAYRAKPALAEKADARLDHSDLTALLALQGIAAPGFG
ncbi:phosphoserine phosphatase [Albimonas donghaensis]|uniref:Phosphoserine phosphatase n=1 Tax=Albimonas donghaensis TaxID=356660 RepID=A0A1H2THW7_9RHOB|nr:phosphoserine phosphatase SerB [Albimonas donghaensis]SDW43511.1 phosphoserine phosphatase [Albimonas donghaensis]